MISKNPDLDTIVLKRVAASIRSEGAIARCLMDLFNESVGNESITSRSRYYSKAEIAEMVAAARFCIVASKGGMVVGCCVVRRSCVGPELTNVCDVSIRVARVAHRKGVGGTLLTGSQLIAQTSGIEQLIAFIYADNHRSVGLFTKARFVQHTEIDGLLTASGKATSKLMFRWIANAAANSNR